MKILEQKIHPLLLHILYLQATANKQQVGAIPTQQLRLWMLILMQSNSSFSFV